MAKDATSIDENVLSEWLFREYPAASRLANHFRFESTSAPSFQIATKTLVPAARGPGDIDVLVSSLERPELSVAFEVKRIKVGATTFSTTMPNKIGQLKHGVVQANLLAELGFNRCYLLVAIVTDGRERDGFNFASRGPTADILTMIDGFSGREALDSKVGLAFVELTQPVDKDIREAGSIGIRTAVEATTVEQPAHLNMAIAAAADVDFRRM